MGGAISSTKACFTGGGGLASAVVDGDDGFVKSALTNNPKLAAATLSVRDGFTAVHLAASEGRLDYLKLLVETFESSRRNRGKSCKTKHVARMLNRRNMHGQTALMLACKFGHADIVSWLLQQGANPMLFDSIHSRVCLHYAALYGQPDCIKALFADDAFVNMSAGPALLINAHVLDSQGFHKYIDVRAAMGFAAIHMASSQGHWQAVVALLRYGASLTVRCYGVLRADFAVPARWKPNSTPLHIAAARGSTTMVKHMLHAYAEQVAREPATPDIRLMRDFADMRPVDIARAYGYQRIAALLDPWRPVELLAYITSGGHMRLGPPALAALAARALRGRLLSELAAIEPSLAEAKAKASRESSTQAGNFGAKGAPPPSAAGQQAGADAASAAGGPSGGTSCFVDDFGCAPGCSHAHCGRRTQPEQQEQQHQEQQQQQQQEQPQQQLLQQQQDSGTGASQPATSVAETVPEPVADAVPEPADQAASAPPGFVRIVGLPPGPASSPPPSRRGMLRGLLSRGGRGGRRCGPAIEAVVVRVAAPAAAGQAQQQPQQHAAAEPVPTQQLLQQQPSVPLMPAPSATAPGSAADPFSASGVTADFPQRASLAGAAVGGPPLSAQTPAVTGSPPGESARPPPLGPATAALQWPGDGPPASAASGFTQRQLSAFASAAFSPFQDDRGDASVEGGSMHGRPDSFQPLRQDSMISMSIRPLLSRDLGDSTAAVTDDGQGHAGGDSAARASAASRQSRDASAGQPHPAGAVPLARSHTISTALLQRRSVAERPQSAASAAPPPSAGYRRTPSSSRLERGQSLGAALGSPPQARRASFLRDAMAALATRTASGMIRRNNSEMVLDARLGDVYTGGDGGPSPASGAVNATVVPPGAEPEASSRDQRVSFDSDAAVQAVLAGEGSEGGDVVVAELNTCRSSVQFLVRRASTGLARAPSAASVAGEECDICFDGPLEVTIRGCSHQFCAPCLRGVCEATPDKTPRCPFCRRVVDGVVPAPAKPALLSGGPGTPVSNRAPLLSGLDDICNAAIAAQS